MITQNQIEILKGKCPECEGHDMTIDGYPQFCSKYQGTGKATIEIEKEWVECPECERHERECSHEGCEYECKLNCVKGKIPKSQVGEEIYYCLVCNKEVNEYHKEKSESDEVIKLKIIPETETHWMACLE